MGYTYALRIALSSEKVFAFFRSLEKWFRLNPQWAVLSLDGPRQVEKGSRFSLCVRYDRSEEEVAYEGTVEEFLESEHLTIRLDGEMPRTLKLRINADRHFSRIEYSEGGGGELSLAEKRELNLWLKSVANYLLIQERKTPWSKLYKWFIDRLWLKMTPSGRRIAFFIVVGEATGFIFFILLLIWLIAFKKL